MFAYIDATTLIALGLSIAVGSYFLAAAMDGVMGTDGFGTIANMLILIAGTFIGLYGADYLKLPAHDATTQAIAGISGAFACLALLASLKALANRFGY